MVNELALRDEGPSESPLDPRLVALIPGAAAALRRLHDAGYAVVGVSNQPAAAKGIVDLHTLERVQARVLELLERERFVPDGFRLCFHHPEGAVPGLSLDCDCRKPRPGMLLSAAAELGLDLAASWMIGDTDADVLAGAAAGCRTILIENPKSAHKRRGLVKPDEVAADLSIAADLIVVSRRQPSRRRG